MSVDVRLDQEVGLVGGLSVGWRRTGVELLQELNGSKQHELVRFQVYQRLGERPRVRILVDLANEVGADVPGRPQHHGQLRAGRLETAEPIAGAGSRVRHILRTKARLAASRPWIDCMPR